MKIVSATHQGFVRTNNEDAVQTDAENGWVILADGIGGLLGGEEASSVAVLAAQDGLQACKPITDVMIAAHKRVLAHADSRNYVGKMGTTLVLWRRCSDSGQAESQAEIQGEYCHVGDSRLYAFDGVELRQLSKDHTVAQRMVDEGIIPADQIHTAPNQNVLTQAVGMPGTLRPEAGSTPTCRRLLLCSDGLSDLVDHTVISKVLKMPDLDACAGQLIKEALDRGGRDNVTVAVVELD